MPQNSVVPTQNFFSPEKIALIKRTIAEGASDDELALFIAQCQRTGLDPFSRQIYSIQRQVYDPKLNRKVSRMVTQVSIDGLRLIAERSGLYAGQLGPFYTTSDVNSWSDIWSSTAYPFAAKVGVIRKDFTEPLYSVAYWSEYCPTYDGKPAQMWQRFPTLMLAKCAEASALRRAFPQELAGLFTPEESRISSSSISIETTTPISSDLVPSIPAITPVENQPDDTVSIPENTPGITLSAIPKVPADFLAQAHPEGAGVSGKEYPDLKGDQGSSPVVSSVKSAPVLPPYIMPKEMGEAALSAIQAHQGHPDLVRDQGTRPYSPLRVQTRLAEFAVDSQSITPSDFDQLSAFFRETFPDPAERGRVLTFLSGSNDIRAASPRVLGAIHRWLAFNAISRPAPLAFEELTGVRLHLSKQLFNKKE